MADPDNGPDGKAGAIPPAPAKKAVKAAKKAPAKKAPVKKAAAKNAPAKKAAEAVKKAPAAATKAVKKAPAALAPKPPQPALEPAAPHAALTAGNAAGSAATPPAAPPHAGIETRPSVNSGRARLPVTMGLAVIGLVAVVLSRFRRG
jgi:hypothetical protein